MGRTKTVKDLAPAGACPDCGGAGYLRRDVPVDHPQFGRPVAGKLWRAAGRGKGSESRGLR